MTSPPSTVEGQPCSQCGGTRYAVHRGRARCPICGSIYRSRSVVPTTRATSWDQGRDIYVRRQRRKESDRSEEAHAARFGGRRVRGSGCGNEKDDVELRGERHEMKETSTSTIKLLLRDWLKVRDSALASGQRPALILTFKRALGRNVQLAVLDIDDYEDLKRRAHEADEHR